MKKILSIIGFMLTAGLLLKDSNAQSEVNNKLNENYKTLTSESAIELNIDLNLLKEELSIHDGDEIYYSVSENEINLEIFRNNEFSESRIDRDGGMY